MGSMPDVVDFRPVGAARRSARIGQDRCGQQTPDGSDPNFAGKNATPGLGTASDQERVLMVRTISEENERPFPQVLAENVNRQEDRVAEYSSTSTQHAGPHSPRIVLLVAQTDGGTARMVWLVGAAQRGGAAETQNGDSHSPAYPAASKAPLAEVLERWLLQAGALPVLPHTWDLVVQKLWSALITPRLPATPPSHNNWDMGLRFTAGGGRDSVPLRHPKCWR
ncbi:hypothetical protein CPLU01_08396 [Colletotrichum plurivorum]|uniref:Uncharacterized protein n=1 Tax=Colletotrichum plurivorum TaxID=2175906 RepID=A0A8H6KBI5_9PEZI|nr:hypothetical protein CPLU01_08396 [Colletotrichum plurivorum]